MTSGWSSSSPSPLSINLVVRQVEVGEISPELLESSASGEVRTIKVSLTNEGNKPARLIWGDFFTRVNSEGWVGGWWESDRPPDEKLSVLFERNDQGPPDELPPGSSTEYTLIDSWPTGQASLEYKFACVVSAPDGTWRMLESDPVTAATVPVEKSSVDQAVVGISSALSSLMGKKDFPPSLSPSQLGVNIEHRPIGPVEVSKFPVLRSEVDAWLRKSSSGDSGVFHVYRTEIVNNTTLPLKLVHLELATSISGKWLTGYSRPALFMGDEIISNGFLEKISSEGVPKIGALKDLWIPPAARLILPSQWHPASASSSPARARWRALLLDEKGSPVYAEGETGESLPPVAMSIASSEED